MENVFVQVSFKQLIIAKEAAVVITTIVQITTTSALINEVMSKYCSEANCLKLIVRFKVEQVGMKMYLVILIWLIVSIKLTINCLKIILKLVVIITIKLICSELNV